MIRRSTFAEIASKAPTIPGPVGRQMVAKGAQRSTTPFSTLRGGQLQRASTPDDQNKNLLVRVNLNVRSNHKGRSHQGIWEPPARR